MSDGRSGAFGTQETTQFSVSQKHVSFPCRPHNKYCDYTVLGVRCNCRMHVPWMLREQGLDVFREK